MAFKGFPTEEAINVAADHCSRGSRYTHQQIAEDILEAGIHIDDWKAAVKKLAPYTDDGELDEVEWQYGEQFEFGEDN